MALQPSWTSAWRMNLCQVALPSPTCNCPPGFFCRVVKNVVCLACNSELEGHASTEPLSSHHLQTVCRSFADLSLAHSEHSSPLSTTFSREGWMEQR